MGIKDEDVSIVEKYSNITNLYEVLYSSENDEIDYTINLENKRLVVREITNDNGLKFNFDYDISRMKCYSDNCDKNYVEKFLDYYWKNLEIS